MTFVGSRASCVAPLRAGGRAPAWATAAALLVPATAASLVLATSAAADPGRVSSVTVMSDRAEVVRRLPAHCQAGAATVRFTGLPGGVDTRTLRALASDKAEIVSVATEPVFAAVHPDPHVAELRKELAAVDKALGDIADGLAVAAEREADTRAYGTYAQSLIAEDMRNPKPDTNAWAGALDALLRSGAVLVTARQEAAAKQRELERRRERLASVLLALDPEARTRTYDAEVAVKCANEQRVEVSLSYVVGGASWRPEYDVRFSPAAEAKSGAAKVELTIGAVVQQSTGEDWDGVSLTLSTAAPRLGGEAPRPLPLYVAGGERTSGKVMVQSFVDASALASGENNAGQAAPTAVAIDDKGTSVSLTVPGAVSVAADSRPVWVPIDTVSGNGTAKLVTIPKLQPFVYQVVTLGNPASYPLLAGTLHSFRRETFVGNSPLAYKAPGEVMEVSLGIDEELRVERKEITDIAKSEGWFAGTKGMYRAYRILLTNNAKSRQSVEVRESVPVSKDEAIEVSLDSRRTTPGFVRNTPEGILTWTVALAPGERKTLDVAYVIRLPDSWQVEM